MKADFPCMGNTPEIPKVFKTSSRVRNKNVTKRQTEMLVKEIWKARMAHRKAGKAGVDLPQMMFLHLQKTKGLHQAVIEVLRAHTHKHTRMHSFRCMLTGAYTQIHTDASNYRQYHKCLLPDAQLAGFSGKFVPLHLSISLSWLACVCFSCQASSIGQVTADHLQGNYNAIKMMSCNVAFPTCYSFSCTSKILQNYS